MNDWRKRQGALLDALNAEVADTVEHRLARARLDGFREGAKLAGVDLAALIFAADEYYLDQGIDRPMCGGEWLTAGAAGEE